MGETKALAQAPSNDGHTPSAPSKSVRNQLRVVFDRQNQEEQLHRRAVLAETVRKFAGTRTARDKKSSGRLSVQDQVEIRGTGKIRCAHEKGLCPSDSLTFASAFEGGNLYSARIVDPGS